MKRKQSEPKICIVDVGSAGGCGAHLPSRKSLCFDPFDENYSENRTVINKCALDRNGPHNFYVLEKREASSIYKPNFKWMKEYWGQVPKRYTIEQEIVVEGIRLDSVLPPVHSYQFLKIDTQGAELKVLQGAENCLDSFLYIETEAFIEPLYDGCPLFHDIEKFLNSFGFVLVGNLRGNSHPVFNDWIFMRQESSYPLLCSMYKKYTKATLEMPCRWGGK